MGVSLSIIMMAALFGLAHILSRRQYSYLRSDILDDIGAVITSIIAFPVKIVFHIITSQWTKKNTYIKFYADKSVAKINSHKYWTLTITFTNKDVAKINIWYLWYYKLAKTITKPEYLAHLI